MTCADSMAVSGLPETEWARPSVDGLPRISVLIPCFNEAAAIGRVVADFHAALPTARVYVYDNNSEDDTVAVARAAGAIVRQEPLQGKGNVVRRMFADIEADVYVLVDGDDTYHAASAPMLVARLLDGPLDMVNAARDAQDGHAYRPGHRFGNRMLTKAAAAIFGDGIGDMLSGYRAFSRRFVKSFPALSSGFEIETELTIHALQLRMPIAEVKTPFQDRAIGSESKLKTFRDGFRILGTILHLFMDEKPMLFFLSLAVGFAGAAVLLSIPLILTYLETGLVPRLPTALVAVGLMVLASLNAVCGLLLNSVTRGRQESKRMRYLAIPASGRSIG